MPVRRVLAALVFLGATAACVAAPATLQTIDGKKHKGDLVRVGEKEVVFQVDGKEITVPAKQVLQIDLGPVRPLPRDAKYTQVELTDGTQLACKELAVKGREVSLKLHSGHEARVPLSAVFWLLHDAQDAARRKLFASRFLAEKSATDTLVVGKADALNGLPGTIGEADENGETIAFTLKDATEKRHPKLANVQGMVFVRDPDPKAPAVRCKVNDTAGNVLLASDVAVTANGYTVTTPAGLKLDLTPEQVARLDYSKGLLTYLSDLEPANLKEKFIFGEGVMGHYRKDKNLDNKPIKLGKETFAKGLSMRATTELEYNLKGEYREFAATIGVDESVGGGDGPTTIIIEGDGKQLFKEVYRRGQMVMVNKMPAPKWPMNVTLNVKNMHRLKIVVTTDELIDLGKHITLGDARVSK